MHPLWNLISPILLSVDVLATSGQIFSRTRSCKKQVLKSPLGRKPVGIALLQASTAGPHLARVPVNVKEKATTQDDSKAWSAEVHAFGRSSSNLMADLYMSQQRSELSKAAAATWADTGSEAVLEQAEDMDESSARKDNSLPDLSSVTASLPSLPSLPPEPSTEDVKAAIQSAPKKIEEAVVAAPAKIESVAAKVYAYQWTFLDMYCFFLFLIGICVLPCIFPLLRYIKVKTWRETCMYKILPLVLIMVLVPLQLVLFEKLGFLTKTVELAEPFVVFTVVMATVVMPVAFMFYEIVMQKLKPYLETLRKLEQKMETVTGVDLDGDGEVASLWGDRPQWLKGLSGEKGNPEDQAGVASEGDDASKKVDSAGKKSGGKQTPKKPHGTSQQPRPAKKGCLTAC